MPITSGAKKTLRSSRRKTVYNNRRRRAIYEVLKEFTRLVREKKKAEAEKVLRRAYQVLDKALKTKLIKKNTASRKKSRLALMVKKIS